jgi:hypothetical protein
MSHAFYITFFNHHEDAVHHLEILHGVKQTLDDKYVGYLNLTIEFEYYNNHHVNVCIGHQNVIVSLVFRLDVIAKDLSLGLQQKIMLIVDHIVEVINLKKSIEQVERGLELAGKIGHFIEALGGDAYRDTPPITTSHLPGTLLLYFRVH